MIVPCKDCEDRHLGCHSKCDKYKEYRTELDAAMHERERRYIVDFPHYQMVKDLSIKKMNRRK